MRPDRKLLNQQQTQLRSVMMGFENHERAIRLFLRQHAVLHSAKMAQSEPWSYEDEILDDMTAEEMRRFPERCEHSVAWCIWHIARIEDVAMNLLVAGSPQVLHLDNWLERMKLSAVDTGNALNKARMAELCAAVDIEALRSYRIAVGRRTRQIVQHLGPKELKQKVDPDRVRQVMDEGAVVEAARAIVDYWGRRSIAGLLLMPATRHNLVHLNEAARLKRRRG